MRRAVLDAAAALFSERGVDGVSLREIAADANVNLGLIGRYIGDRDTLIGAVVDDLSDQLAQSVLDNPLSGQGYEPDAVMRRWVRIFGSLTLAGHPAAARTGFNPVLALARTFEEHYGVDPRSARIRSAQIAAITMGWRLFEDWLIAAGELGDMPPETLRDEIVHTARRLAATPWPSPPDPPTLTASNPEPPTTSRPSSHRASRGNQPN